MATFRSILSRWVFAVAIFCVSLTSIGAAFAPLNLSFQGPFDPVRVGSSLGSRMVSVPVEVKSSASRDTAFSRLEELVLTHRAISVSA